jgi:hypothetical protein
MNLKAKSKAFSQKNKKDSGADKTEDTLNIG